MAVQPVEDRPVGCVRGRNARRIGRHVAQCRGRDEEPAIRVCLRHDGREVAIADGKMGGQRVVVRELCPGEVTHGGRTTVSGEPHVGAVVPAQVGRVPVLADLGVHGHRGVRHGIGQDVAAVRRRVVVERSAVARHLEAVAPAEPAEVIVERVVLHHEDDHVFDGGEHVRPGWGMRVGEAVGPAERPRGSTLDGPTPLRRGETRHRRARQRGTPEQGPAAESSFLAHGSSRYRSGGARSRRAVDPRQARPANLRPPTARPAYGPVRSGNPTRRRAGSGNR